MEFTSDRIHMVPVPERHLPAVYSLLGDLMRRDQDGGVSTADDEYVEYDDGSPKSLVDQANGYWSRRQVIELAETLGGTPAGLLLDQVAIESPRSVPFSELLHNSADPNVDRLKAQLANLTKFVRRTQGRRSWPMSTSDVSGESTYRMPEQIAEWWIDGRYASMDEESRDLVRQRSSRAEDNG